MGIFKMILSAVTHAAAAIFNKIRETGRRILTKVQEFCGKVLNWASKQINKLKEKAINVYGSVYSLIKTENGFTRKAEHYTMCQNGEWIKNTTYSTKEIPESEVPADILEKALSMGIKTGESIDISDKTQTVADEMQELELAV